MEGAMRPPKPLAPKAMQILNSSQNTEIALSSHPVFDVFLASYRKKFLEQVIEIYFTYNRYIINNMDNIIKKNILS